MELGKLPRTLEIDLKKLLKTVPPGIVFEMALLIESDLCMESHSSRPKKWKK